MKDKKEEKTAQQRPVPDYMRTIYKGREYMWLAFTVISVVLAIYETATRKEGEGNETAYYFVGLTFIAGLLYSFHRYRRRKFEKREAEEKIKSN